MNCGVNFEWKALSRTDSLDKPQLLSTFNIMLRCKIQDFEGLKDVTCKDYHENGKLAYDFRKYLIGSAPDPSN